jgi:hypothetical protein
MIDPHVERLHYRITPVDRNRYDNPPSVSGTQLAFGWVLDGTGQFVATMLQHYPTVADARGPVDEYLRAWQLKAAIARGQPEFDYQFDDADIVDRVPPKPGTFHVQLAGVEAKIYLSVETDAIIIHKAYPAPPVAPAQSPLVETLWASYERYLKGRLPLTHMAYYCVTALTYEAGGGVDNAAKHFAFQKDLLKKISEISSARSGPEARKVNGGPPATAAELEWLSAAVLAVIRHVAAAESGTTAGRLTMADLPPL